LHNFGRRMEARRLSELAQLAGVPWEGESDPLIRGAAGFGDAGPDQITFVDDRKLEKQLEGIRAGAVVVRPGVPCPVPALRCDSPRQVFAGLLGLFAPSLDRVLPLERHPTAVVDPAAEVAADVALGPYSVVGPGAVIGAGCRLGAHVVVEADARLGASCLLHTRAVVRERCVLGDRVVLHAGTVVGGDGFGYVPGPEGLVKIPQIGIVVLEDDVEVGVNSCIDRATAGETRVKRGTKIDNLVQIAHNVVVGSHCAISAQTGISGSCVLGDGVVMGGQVGCADHLTLGDGARIAAKSGLTRDVPAGQAVFGYPALEFNRAFRLVALSHRLPELFKRVARLESAAADGRSEED